MTFSRLFALALFPTILCAAEPPNEPATTNLAAANHPGGAGQPAFDYVAAILTPVERYQVAPPLVSVGAGLAGFNPLGSPQGADPTGLFSQNRSGLANAFPKQRLYEYGRLFERGARAPSGGTQELAAHP